MDDSSQHYLRVIASVTTAVAVALCLFSLAGWLISPDIFSENRLDYIPMAPESAVSLFVLGFVLLLFINRPDRAGYRYLVVLSAVLVSVYSAAVIVEYITGSVSSIHTLLPESSAQIDGMPTNISSPVTASSLIVASASLLLLALAGGKRKAVIASTVAVMLAGLNALVIAFAYIYGVPLMHNGKIYPMSIISSAAIILLSIGLLASAGQDYWPMRLFVGRTLQARLMRVFLPLTLFIVMVEGWFIHAVNYKLPSFNPALVTSMLALVFLGAAGLLVMRLVQSISGSIDKAEVERQMTELDLRRSEERYRELFERSPVSIWEEDFSRVKDYIDNLGLGSMEALDSYFTDNPAELIHCASLVNIIDVNQAAVDMYEADSKEELLAGLDRVFNEESLFAFKTNLLALMDGRTSTQIDAETITLKGRAINNIIRWSVVPGFEKSLGRLVVSISDVTKQKEHEEDLNVKTRQLEDSQRVAHIGSWDWDIVNNQITWSDELWRIFGLEPQSFKPTYEDFLDMVHPDDREMLDNAVRKSVAEKTNYHVDARIIRRDGSQWVMEAIGEVTCDDAGNPTRMGGTAQDVTERKLSEEELRQSEQRFRDLFEGAPDALFIADAETGIVVGANTEASNLLKRPHDEIIGMHQSEVHPPEVDEQSKQLFEEHIRQSIETSRVTPVDSEVIRSDGSTVPVEIMAQMVYQEGKPLIQGTFRDITERKQARDELYSSREQYRLIFDKSPVGITQYDRKSVITECNEHLAEIIGTPREKMIGINMLKIMTNEGQKKALLESLAGRTGYFEGEYQSVTSGKSTIMSTIYSPTFAPDGAVDGGIAITTDISERQRAEKNLKESEEKLRTIITNSQPIIFMIDRNGIFQLSEGKSLEVLGLKPGEAVGKSALEMYADFPEIIKGINEALSGRVYRDTIDVNGSFFDIFYSPYRGSDGEVAGLMGMAVDITDKQNAQAALENSEEKYRLLFEDSPVAFAVHRGGVLMNANQAAADLMGASRPNDLIGRKVLEFVHPDYHRDVLMRMQKVMKERIPVPPFEEKFIRLDGGIIDVEVSAMPVDYEGEEAVQVAVVDITGHKRLEEQLIQAQKMESVGNMAGGVAHDFNNYLTAIEGYIDLALMDMPEGSSHREELEEARRAADRAARLTRQLLLFSRREPMDLRPTDISSVVRGLHHMLDRLLGEKYTLATDLKDSVWIVKADASHLEQVIMNLVVNARDAMPDGGKISVSTSDVHVDEDYAIFHRDVAPGKYVCLEVSDEGVGMDNSTLDHIFEPFFSTKTSEQGTGLGLSVVYGIVTEHGGWIDVDSATAIGTSFKVFIPVITSGRRTAPENGVLLNSLTGNGERVLLVEDEDAVRALANRMLSEHGYEVYAAGGAEEAMGIFNREDGNFDIVFSDVVLPGEDGVRLVDKLQQRKPDLPVLLASGYSGDELNRSEIERKGYRFMQKPYSLSDLMQAINDLLHNN